MFAQQKAALDQAQREFNHAVSKKQAASDKARQQRAAFLGKPTNLLFPFVAGALVSASQLKSNPEGLNRIPFMNLAKMGIGIYALASRIRQIRQRSVVKEPSRS